VQFEQQSLHVLSRSPRCCTVAIRLSHLAELLQPQEEQAVLLFCPRLACERTTRIAETALHYSRTPRACCSARNKRQPPQGTSSAITAVRHETPAQGPAAQTRALESACPRGSFTVAPGLAQQSCRARCCKPNTVTHPSSARLPRLHGEAFLVWSRRSLAPHRLATGAGAAQSQEAVPS
jgi:hypothetical protein